ncbi:Alkylated DNA repair protein alkB 8 [Coelomomyces lativittatus]|nr:Alkylated DNA repair protein alkB 8 [Coelomomyces lativittatus]
MLTFPHLPGLFLIENFIDEFHEQTLISYLDSNTWSGQGTGIAAELKRRVQQYGYSFSYRYRKVMEQLNPVPEILHLSSETLRFHGVQENVIQEINQMDQVIVNEYLADQGIMYAKKK